MSKPESRRLPWRPYRLASPPRPSAGPSWLHADLAGATLTNADFDHANRDSSNLSGSDIAGANLNGAHLAGVISGTIIGTPAMLPKKLTDANLTGITGNGTTCPDGTKSDNDGDTCVNNF